MCRREQESKRRESDGGGALSTYSETFRALRPTTDVVIVRRANTDLRRGIRLALGAAVPLVLGVLLGHVEYGVFAALGALPAGFAATTGARAKEHSAAVLLSAFGMAVASFAGAVLADRPWLVVAALASCAYAAGLCSAFSPRISIATLQWPVALLLATATPSGPGGAALRAALVLTGGAWQALLTFLDTRHEQSYSFERNLRGEVAEAADATAKRRKQLRSPGVPGMPGVPLTRSLRRIGATLHAGLDPRSAHGQHVLRLALVATVTHAIAIMAGLSHGYWAALTAILVLKPEHATTIRRSLDRIGGTAIGVLLGVVLAWIGAAGTLPLLLVATLALVLAYAVFTANYFVFCVFLTGFVVLLLDLLGDGAAQTAVSRLAATAIGGTIALAASHIRPREAA